jgi:hypothetical protein
MLVSFEMDVVEIFRREIHVGVYVDGVRGVLPPFGRLATPGKSFREP